MNRQIEVQVSSALQPYFIKWTERQTNGWTGKQTNKLTDIVKQVAWNKSSLLLNLQIQSTQTLQLFTWVIKTESIYKSYKLPSRRLIGFRNQLV